MLDHKKYNKNDSLWDRYLGMTAAMTQVPVGYAEIESRKMNNGIEVYGGVEEIRYVVRL